MPHYVYEKKYGVRDYRGGGRSSARETASRVVAGAIAKQMLSEIKINAYVSSVGPLFLEKPYQELDFSKIESNPVRCPDQKMAAEMEEYIKQIKKDGDTVGGTVTCVIQNVPIRFGRTRFRQIACRIGQSDAFDKCRERF